MRSAYTFVDWLVMKLIIEIISIKYFEMEFLDLQAFLNEFNFFLLIDIVEVKIRVNRTLIDHFRYVKVLVSRKCARNTHKSSLSTIFLMQSWKCVHSTIHCSSQSNTSLNKYIRNLFLFQFSHCILLLTLIIEKWIFKNCTYNVFKRMWHLSVYALVIITLQ